MSSAPTLHVATRKGVFTLARVDGKWRIERVSFLAENATLVLPDRRTGTLWTTLAHGHFGVKLHSSLDGGATWTERAVPTYPEKPEGSTDVNPISRRETPWSLELIWSLEAGAPDRPDELWCGTIPGGLFHSVDGGDSWSLVRSLWEHPARAKWMGGGMDWPGIHSICVHPRDPSDVLVGVSCGGAWRTRDGGATWAQAAQGMRADYAPPEHQHDPDIQDPHRIVQCPSDPDWLWTQHHNGIFRSTDGAASWEAVEPQGSSDFGFAVAVHPSDPRTAWFVPAQKDEHRVPVGGRVVVTRTRDGGDSFEELSRGLPSTHAYDLVYRHALDVDASGERLAFGSTTGNLWVSETSGDSWEHVSAHLPPIHCVRFG